MEACCTPPEKRTWIFFFLILLVALLWASFLLLKGQMVAMSAMLAITASLISFFSFTFCRKYRTWIFFYLIVLTAILWASFLLMQGVMIRGSALLFLLATGTTIFSFLFCETEQ